MKKTTPHSIAIGKGTFGKTKPKKGEHNQYAVDKKNSAEARKKARETGKSHKYKTKRVM